MVGIMLILIRAQEEIKQEAITQWTQVITTLSRRDKAKQEEQEQVPTTANL